MPPWGCSPIPFVRRDDDGPAFVGDQVGDRQILPLQRLQRVDHQNDILGKRTARSVSATDSRSSRASIRARRRMRRYRSGGSAAPQFQSIAIESRVMPGSGPVNTRSSPIRRLTRVDCRHSATDDGKLQRLFGLILAVRGLVAGFLRRERQQPLVQLAQSFPVAGG